MLIQNVPYFLFKKHIPALIVKDLWCTLFQRVERPSS